LGHLAEGQLATLKRLLLERKTELTELLGRDHHGLDEPMGESVPELSMYDNHPGDIGTELFERSKDLALVDKAEHQLEEVELALLNLESGRYGTCVVCGEPIPYERLEAIPWTGVCILHAESEPSQDRPVEEEMLNPPFGRTSLDETDDPQFDGEDAWQIVARYGTATSPAMAEQPDEFTWEDPYLESDELEGYVEPLESFLATDLRGETREVIRNNQYKTYMQKGEGDRTLEFPGEVDPIDW
jgi:YteA family regulatory protein